MTSRRGVFGRRFAAARPAPTVAMLPPSRRRAARAVSFSYFIGTQCVSTGTLNIMGVGETKCSEYILNFLRYIRYLNAIHKANVKRL